MKFIVINRGEAVKFEAFSPYAVISITEPGVSSAQYPSSEFCNGILYLRFYDVDPSGQQQDDINCRYLEAFDSKHARKVIQFALIMQETELIVCQCIAGISRSAGIAAALSKIFNEEDDFFFSRYTPNRHVYRTILEVYYNEFA